MGLKLIKIQPCTHYNSFNLVIQFCRTRQFGAYNGDIEFEWVHHHHHHLYVGLKRMRQLQLWPQSDFMGHPSLQSGAGFGCGHGSPKFLKNLMFFNIIPPQKISFRQWSLMPTFLPPPLLYISFIWVIYLCHTHQFSARGHNYIIASNNTN